MEADWNSVEGALEYVRSHDLIEGWDRERLWHAKPALLGGEALIDLESRIIYVARKSDPREQVACLVDGVSKMLGAGDKGTWFYVMLAVAGRAALRDQRTLADEILEIISVRTDGDFDPCPLDYVVYDELFDFVMRHREADEEEVKGLFARRLGMTPADFEAKYPDYSHSFRCASAGV